MSDTNGDFQDRIQRIMNDYKRKELTEKYGGQFDPESNPDLPPEVEAQWLDNIDEFESQFEKAGRIGLSDYIGSPAIIPLADIAPIDLETKLDQLLDLLAEHDVFVDFLHDIDDAEAYRFITEKLLNEEVDDIHIPGFQQHFIYEEFHPNDKDDATFWAEEFLDAFFGNDEEWLRVVMGKQGTFDPHSALKDLRTHQDMISHFTVKITKCEVQGDDASVDAALSWDVELPASDDVVMRSARVALRLKRSPHTGWDVVEATLPGGKSVGTA